jgi:hypothetical protein
MSPTIDVVSNYVERSQAFEGTPVQRLLHRQRLARRMAKEHRHRFTSDALCGADWVTAQPPNDRHLPVVAPVCERKTAA